MRVIIRTALGLALAAGGLTFLTYGIAQAVENGSCGSGSNGVSYGAPCPSGFGPMILLMILGVFVALGGAALAGVLGRFLAALFIAVIAGVVFGIVDLDDTDTRPGLEIVIAVVAPLLLFTLPAVGRTRPKRVVVNNPLANAPVSFTPEPDATARPQWQAKERPTQAQAEDLAGRLRQLQQLKEAGLMSDAEFAERRNQMLADL